MMQLILIIITIIPTTFNEFNKILTIIEIKYDYGVNTYV